MGILFSELAGYDGELVGDIPVGAPPISLDLPWAEVGSLVLPAVVICLVSIAEAGSIARTFAALDRRPWNANREFVSQGLANLTAGASGGYPVCGSFSRSALNRVSGANSRWSGAITGVVVLAFLPFAAVLESLPTKAILGAIVIGAVLQLIKLAPILRLWRLREVGGEQLHVVCADLVDLPAVVALVERVTGAPATGNPQTRGERRDAGGRRRRGRARRRARRRAGRLRGAGPAAPDPRRRVPDPHGPPRGHWRQRRRRLRPRPPGVR